MPKTPHSLPGPFPGKVVKVTDPRSLVDERVDGKVVAEMVERGIRTLTGTSMKKSFQMFFTRDDVVGLKVNPVGPPLISTKPEIAEAVIRWLVDNKLPCQEHRDLGPLRPGPQGRRIHRIPLSRRAHSGAADHGARRGTASGTPLETTSPPGTSTPTSTTSPRAWWARACAATRTTSST